MNIIPINSTTNLISQSGRRKTIEKHLKRVNYCTLAGIWSPIDCNISDNIQYNGHNGYGFEALEHDLLLGFAPSDKGMPLMRITDSLSGGVWALWFMGYDDVQPQNPVIPKLVNKVDNRIWWEVDDKLTIKFEVLGHKIRKLLILNSRPAWNKLTFRVARSGGAHLVAGDIVKPNAIGKLLAFRKNDTIPLFGFSEPSVWDSSGEETMRIKHIPEYNIKQVRAGVWDIEIILDPNWLDGATYPVYIDPTLVLQPDGAEGEDTEIWTGYPNHNYGTCGDIFMRKPNDLFGLIKFDVSTIIGMYIINATLSMTPRSDYWDTPDGITLWADRVNKEWGEGGTCHGEASAGWATWNSAQHDILLWDIAGCGGIPEDRAGNEEPKQYYADEPEQVELNVTEKVKEWADGINNYGLFLCCDDPPEKAYCNVYSSDYGTAGDRPKLTIEYEEPSAGMPAKLGALAGSRILSPLATGLLK